jgi:histone H3/H4
VQWVELQASLSGISSGISEDRECCEHEGRVSVGWADLFVHREEREERIVSHLKVGCVA